MFGRCLEVLGSVFGLIAIILGAFASHGLKNSISSDALLTFETGVRYQMYHAFLLIIIGATRFLNDKTKRWVLYLVGAGIFCFSGSIYGLATNELTGFDFKNIALVTPLGGLLFIISWALIAIASFRGNKA